LKHYLRNAIRLGTSLTALFLLVRCGVPERDYSKLGIGENAGSGGSGDVLHSSGGEAGIGGEGGSSGSAGSDGLGDAGSDQGGSAGAPPAPIPCNPIVSDAGTVDAGAGDAGANDAGSVDAGADESASACACVNGFIKAIDVDGDGDGTRACSSAPGLDCDDADPAVTHNACGGCTVLSNAIGDDCGDCGTYACDGTDGVKCVSKPGPVEDPDCRCLAGLIVARDTDGDGAGTRLCEQNPGIDCNDGNTAFITDQCGGCDESPPGTLGSACNQCGIYTCSGTAIVCGPNPSAGGHCTDNKNRQTCNSNGFWGNDALCPNVCYQGNCQTCTPNTFLCGAPNSPFSGDIILYKCLENVSSSSTGISWYSWASCTTTTGCNATTGACTGYLFLPRDRTFDVAPSQRDGLPWHDILNTASDSDYG
jgi:hypothetical protein